MGRDGPARRIAMVEPGSAGSVVDQPLRPGSAARQLQRFSLRVSAIPLM
jgi:hypothetical protein